MPKANVSRPPRERLGTKADTQTSLRMPTDLRERLQAAADANRRGIGHEIVDRLETSFATPRQSDANTGELLSQIAEAAQLLARHWTPWHKDRDAFRVFKDAVAALIDQYQPEETGTPKSRQAEVMFGGADAGERLALTIFWKAQ
jgi:hypothetical protein